MLESLGIPGGLLIHRAVPAVRKKYKKKEPWSHVLPLINPLTSVGFQGREDEEDLVLYVPAKPGAAFWE